MIELMFLLYFIETLVAIDKLLCKFIIALVLTIPFIPLFSMMAYDIWGISFEDVFSKYVKPHIKRYIIALVISILTATLIPSERTMYIMAGLYTGDKVIDTVSNSETFQKAEKVLNKKLDEMLGDPEK